MASHKQELLGRLLDHNSPCVGEEELALAKESPSERRALDRRFGNSSIGDRASNRLALDIAMATPLATAAAIALTNQDKPAPSASTQSSYQPNRAFNDEIDRQIAESKNRPSPSRADPPGYASGKVTLEPGKPGTITLYPKTPTENPKISLDFSGVGDRVDDFKLIGITQDDKKILPQTSLADLAKRVDRRAVGVYFPGTVSKDHPIRITLVLTTGKWGRDFTLYGYLNC
jgi:hypothetical protein